jgi:hypothetical protein
LKHRPAFRRAGALAALTALASSALALLPAGAGAEDDFITGSGMAQAQILRAGPAASQLALAPIVGLSLADYLGTEGRGDARVFEWGALDGSIPADFKAQTPSVRVTSSDDGAAQGKDGAFAGAPSGSPFSAGAMQQHADANKQPLGHSLVKMDGFSLPGAYEFSGGTAETWAGITKPGTREAHAVTRIGNLSLGGGAVKLTGLKWETFQRTGADAVNTGTFSVEGIQIGGQTLAPPAPDQLASAFTAMNTALAPTGVVLDPPHTSKEGGIASVSPLGIRIVNSQVGNTAVAPVVGALQPVREPVTGAVLNGPPPPDQLPGPGTAILLADVFTGVATGAGRFDAELGGVSGYTEGTKYEGYNFDFTSGFADLGASNDFAGGSFASDLGSSPSSAGATFDSTSLGSSTGSALGATSAAPTAGTRTPGAQQALTAASTRSVKPLGKKGGAAVLVGLVGLLGALGLAGADYRTMRAGRRTITV